MIAFVKGTVVQVDLTGVVVEVGGVGLQLLCTPRTLADLRVGESATLPTSMIVREDSMTLFGFAEADEKQMFELLLTASGVGPKLAQATLAVHSPEVLRAAIGNEDVRSLTAVPGIGQKGAQRMILELKDKVGAVPGAVAATGVAVGGQWAEQVATGLVGLGWSAKEADKAVAAVADQAGDDPDVAKLLRAALQMLGTS